MLKEKSSKLSMETSFMRGVASLPIMQARNISKAKLAIGLQGADTGIGALKWHRTNPFISGSDEVFTW